MADYKRYISYVYVYRNGVKENNIGFAKLEAKMGKVKLTLSLKGNEIKNSELRIYMFYRKLEEENNTDINLIEIDKCVCDKDEYSITHRTNMDNVFNSGLDIEKMAGVIVLLDGVDCIGTEWDDKGIDIRKIIKEDKEGSENIEEIIIEEVKEDKEEIIMNLNKFNESKITRIDTSNSNNGIKSNEDDVKIEKERINNVDMHNAVANKIFTRLPGMYPFEDDEIIECVKIEPQDMGLFTMDKWPLANNSFLLHGYYTYRHLIFARMRTRKAYKFILGVPGIFRDRERFMANMFGFSGFKGVRNKPLNNGEFGYWYLEIKL